jgi:hypothetical protein
MEADCQSAAGGEGGAAHIREQKNTALPAQVLQYGNQLTAAVHHLTGGFTERSEVAVSRWFGITGAVLVERIDPGERVQKLRHPHP